MTGGARRAGLTLSIYAVILGGAVPLLLYSFQPPAQSLVVDRADFARADVERPDDIPADAWLGSVALPHDWRRAGTGGTRGWYRAHFVVDETPHSLWAVALPTVRYNARVLLNGRALGSGGRMDDPVARNVRNALLFSVPEGLIREGQNTLHVLVRSGPDRIGYLDEIYVGDHDALSAPVRVHNTLRVTAAQGTTALLFFMSVVIGALALVRKSDREYFYFALGTFIWAIHSLGYFVVDVPFGDRFWDWLRFTTIGLFAFVGGIVYVHRYLGVRHPFIEKRILIVLVAIALGMGVLSDAAFYFFAFYVWHPLCQVFAFYGLMRMLAGAWSERDYELHFVAASGAVMVAYALHDLMVMWGAFEWRRGYLLHYSLLYSLGLFCAVLLKRFVEATNALESLNRELEARVAATHGELTDTYARNRALESRRAVAEERDRIMRDMHDGMGGQLITTLALIEEKKADLPSVANALRAALQDLRLMIDSLDVAGEDITTMLGMFRARIEPSLQTHDIALTWRVEPIGEIQDFGSAKALQVLRILQEAVTNVIKHSGADEIVLSAKDRATPEGGRQVIVVLTDNGRGLDGGGGRGSGRGIANMLSRAKAVGALLDIRSDGGGTTVELRLNR